MRCRKELQKRFWSHLHGKALAEAAFYPAGLRLALLRGMRDTLDHETRELDESVDVTTSTMMAREPGNSMDRSISSMMRRDQESKEETYKVADFNYRNGTKCRVAFGETMKA